ncbi:pyridoxamine 5'-phosphate oxidase family protein [Streptosporangium sp. NPDC023615]|uniref:pyridoxamine 5'-phosphate oxidase family protein n=1 Tax=Streptosporangium sp. NPDC023615 TaxID=3154794 RepID=UPI003428A6ED
MSSQKLQALVRKTISKQTFCTIATSSAANRPHVAGMLYAETGGKLYMATLESTVKARNVRQNRNVAICVPCRRYPFSPPFTLQFQGTAEILDAKDPHIQDLIGTGRLKAITSLGEAEMEGICFIVVTPGRRVATYGLGLSLMQWIRSPLHAAGSVELS